MKRKICIVTGTEAEYGLLFSLMKEIEKDKDLELQIIVTGMHLSPDFGLTYKEIEKDFKIDKKIEMFPKLNTPVSISNSIGLANIGFGNAFDNLLPDLVIVSGNSYTSFAAVTASAIANIKTLNIFSKNIEDNSINKVIGEAIIKMSYLHFVENEKCKNDFIKLGEASIKVYVFEDLVNNLNIIKNNI